MKYSHKLIVLPVVRMSAIHIEVFYGPLTETRNALMKKGVVIINIATSRAMWNSGSALAN